MGVVLYESWLTAQGGFGGLCRRWKMDGVIQRPGGRGGGGPLGRDPCQLPSLVTRSTLISGRIETRDYLRSRYITGDPSPPVFPRKSLSCSIQDLYFICQGPHIASQFQQDTYLAETQLTVHDYLSRPAMCVNCPCEPGLALERKP